MLAASMPDEAIMNPCSATHKVRLPPMSAAMSRTSVSRSVRPKPRALDRHLTDIWFGDDYLVKARAFRIAQDRLAAWRS